MLEELSGGKGVDVVVGGGGGGVGGGVMNVDKVEPDGVVDRTDRELEVILGLT